MTVRAPRSDAEVPAFVRALGIPGLIDIHTHFMPQRVLDAVWRFFDAVETPDGGGWPITYRESEQQRLARLRAMNVRGFTALSYPHKPDMAQSLNAYSAQLAATNPDCVHSATFYPEPDAAGYVAAALADGARVFKAHVQVGAYDPRDPLLVPVWSQLSDAGVAVVVHAGSGPMPGPFTGPGPFSEVLARHPELTAVVAHMGGGEYREFLDLALRYPQVHLDTTMTFTDYMSVMTEYPRDLLPLLRDHPQRIVLGTDFPNIPHPYAHQLESLVRLDLGDDWLRAVCHDNGARLLGLGGSGRS